MKIRMEANIVLQLRDQDVNLLLKAVQHYTAENEEEENNRKFLLDILGYLAIPA